MRKYNETDYFGHNLLDIDEHFNLFEGLVFQAFEKAQFTLDAAISFYTVDVSNIAPASEPETVNLLESVAEAAPAGTVLIGDLVQRDRINEDSAVFLDSAWGVHSIELGGKMFIYATGDLDDGISVFELGSTGKLTSVQNLPDDVSTRLDGSTHFESVTIGANTYLYANGRLDSSINVFSVASDGMLTFVDSVTDNGILRLLGTHNKMQAVDIGGSSFLMATGWSEGGFSVFEIENDGTLTNTDNYANGAILSQPRDIQTLEVGGTTFAFVTSFDKDSVTAFSIDNVGDVTFLNTYLDDATLQLDGATGLVTKTIGGTGFVFVSGLFDSGISVFSVDSAGVMTNVFNISDTPSLSLEQADSMDIVELGGETFLAINARIDDALTVFHVDGTGVLTEIDVESNPDLDNAIFVRAAFSGGNPFLVSSAHITDVLSTYEIGGGDDVLTGGGTDDIILGLAGDDTLIGGDGNDVLAGGTGADSIDGGMGTDTLTFAEESADINADLVAGTASSSIERIDLVGASTTAAVLAAAEAGNIYFNVHTFSVPGGEIRGQVGDVLSDTTDGSGVRTVVFETISLDSGQEVPPNASTGQGEASLVFVVDTGGNVTYSTIIRMTIPLMGDISAAHLHQAAAGSNGGVVANILGAAGATLMDETDTLSNLENIIGGTGDDSLLGDANVNVIDGGDGDDFISGRGGDDSLTGGAGGDTLDGGNGLDMMFGGAGDDSFRVEEGELVAGEIYDAGAGTDRLVVTGDGSSFFDFRTSTLVSFEKMFINHAFGGGETMQFNADQLSGIMDVTIADPVSTGAHLEIFMEDLTTLDLSLIVLNNWNGDDSVSIFGDADAETITGSFQDDIIISGGGDDFILGGDGDDLLDAGAGGDQISGGAGNDTLTYATSDAGVIVNLATGLSSGGHAAADAFTLIENLTGSTFDDALTGDANDNILMGGDGNDTLTGGAGADELDGGSGVDTASYAGSFARVFVNLNNGNGNFADAAGDTLAGIENLIGSDFDDELRGDGGVNVLTGGLGNDDLRGGGGNDILEGGAGADTLNGQGAFDTASYAGSAGRVVINLINGVANLNDATGDTLVSIENLLGSDFNDIFNGSHSRNTINGGLGDDYVSGRGGSDTLFGGDGNDSLLGGGARDFLTGGAGNDRLNGGTARDVFIFADDFGTDTIEDFEDNRDDIDFSGNTSFNSIADVLAAATQMGADVHIVDGANTLVLENFDLGDLGPGDFIF